MSPDIEITSATEADLPSIKKLLAELITTVEDNAGFDVEPAFMNCRKLLKKRNSYILVAKINNEIVGFVNFTTRKSILHQGPSGLIDELIVSQSRRGSGIGKKLIMAVNEKCRNLGCSELEVSTEKSNIQARRFYKSCGFGEDAVLLELNL